MSTEPTLALQKAIIAALRADPDTVALVSTRVWDRVKLQPNPAEFPYIRVGDEDQAVDAGADCLEHAVTVYAMIHAFSREVGKPELKRIAGAIRRRLHQARDLTLDDNSLILILCEDTQVFSDGDGLTEHAVLRFRAEIEPY